MMILQSAKGTSIYIKKVKHAYTYDTFSEAFALCVCVYVFGEVILKFFEENCSLPNM